jgi:hypothetical protein
MADVFLSYAQEDRTAARKLADALRELGWDVWWDAQVYVGARFRAEITSQLQSAKCVVVLWSQASIESDWVIDEAEEGKKRGVLVQALIDAAQPPHGFRGIQWANLNSWSGDTHAKEFVKLADGISRHATPTPPATPRAPQPGPSAHTVIDSGVHPPKAKPHTALWWRATSAAVLANRRRLSVGGIGLASVIAAMIYSSSLPTERQPVPQEPTIPTTPTSVVSKPLGSDGSGISIPPIRYPAGSHNPPCGSSDIPQRARTLLAMAADSSEGKVSASELEEAVLKTAVVHSGASNCERPCLVRYEQ